MGGYRTFQIVDPSLSPQRSINPLRASSILRGLYVDPESPVASMPSLSEHPPEFRMCSSTMDCRRLMCGTICSAAEQLVRLWCWRGGESKSMDNCEDTPMHSVACFHAQAILSIQVGDRCEKEFRKSRYVTSSLARSLHLANNPDARRRFGRISRPRQWAIIYRTRSLRGFLCAIDFLSRVG